MSLFVLQITALDWFTTGTVPAWVFIIVLLMASVVGERGRHTHTAFTPARLPMHLAIELVVVAAVKSN